MKNLITEIIQDVFPIKKQQILLPKEPIVIEAEMGKGLMGSIRIKLEDSIPFDGSVDTPLLHMKLEDCKQIGDELIIQYNLNAAALGKKQKIESYIEIILSSGEYKIPYEIKVDDNKIQSSMGELKDLYQFTNLAQKNWEEAVKLFGHEDFERVFLIQQDKLALEYRLLLKGRSLHRSLEEFLQVSNKKSAIQVVLDCNESNCTMNNQTILQKFKILKHGWGHIHLELSTDSDFIYLNKQVIASEDFYLDQCEVEYLLLKDKMKQGKNYGRIFVDNGKEKMMYYICAINQKPYELTVSQLSFQTNDIGKLSIKNRDNREIAVKIRPNGYLSYSKMHETLSQDISIDFRFNVLDLRKNSAFNQYKELILLIEVDITCEDDKFMERIPITLSNRKPPYIMD